MFANFKRIFARISGQETPWNGSGGVGVAEEGVETSNREEVSESVSIPTTSGGSSGPPRESIAISLRQIVDGLPAGLKAKVQQQPASSARIEVPLQPIIDQLASGHARITFSELVEASPPGVFMGALGQESAVVDLPLSEVIPQLHAGALARRAPQRTLEIPPATWSVFGAKGQMLHQLKAQPAGRPTPPNAAPPALPTRPQAAVIARGNGATSNPVPESAPVFQMARSTVPAEPTPQPRPIPAPALVPMPKLGPSISVNGSHAAPRLNNDDRTIPIKVESVMGGWPEAVLQEVTRLQLAALNANLPLREIEQAMKQGKITFTWKQIRSWIKRVPPVTTASPQDEVKLELPLGVVVPLFLAQQTTTWRPKLEVASNIPDVFSGPRTAARSQQPSEAAAPTAPVAPIALTPPTAPPLPATPAVRVAPIVRMVPAPACPAPEPTQPSQPGASSSNEGGGDLSQIFGQTYTSSWTPTEIVQKTSLLAGVAGSVVGLDDGLLVASRMPPTLNAEALAGFLPQIFSNISDCTKEIRLGEPTRVLIQFNNLPLAIFKAGKLFFAVLGREGAALPVNQLSAVATHLAQQAV